jgi:hypothetical protein
VRQGPAPGQSAVAACCARALVAADPGILVHAGVLCSGAGIATRGEASRRQTSAFDCGCCQGWQTHALARPRTRDMHACTHKHDTNMRQNTKSMRNAHTPTISVVGVGRPKGAAAVVGLVSGQHGGLVARVDPARLRRAAPHWLRGIARRRPCVCEGAGLELAPAFGESMSSVDNEWCAAAWLGARYLTCLYVSACMVVAQGRGRGGADERKQGQGRAGSSCRRLTKCNRPALSMPARAHRLAGASRSQTRRRGSYPNRTIEVERTPTARRSSRCWGRRTAPRASVAGAGQVE